MRIAILQPSYLPWLGYLDQIACVDRFVFYDDVQYDRRGWRNRNRIRTESAEGWSWVTVPVRRADYHAKLNEIDVDNNLQWQHKHVKAIENWYARAPFVALFDSFRPLFEARYAKLVDLAIESTAILMRNFNVSTPTCRSSELAVAGVRNERLINICKAVGAHEYLSGQAARAYLDVDLFQKSGIRVIWQDYRHPEYRQPRQPFVSHLSALDALLNTGPQSQTYVGKKGDLLQR